MTLCEVSLLHIKFLHWTASSNLTIFLRLVKEIIYANAGSWSVTNKEVFNVNVVALQWHSTLRCKMRSSNWIVFSSLSWRWSFDEEDAIPPFLLDNLFLSTHSPCPYMWNANPADYSISGLSSHWWETSAVAGITQLPQLIHSGSTAIKYSVVSRVISVTHVINQSAESKRGK